MTAPEPISAPEPVTAAHQLAGFDCGVPVMNEWLKRRALANESSGASRTFVACSGARVVGYYSLAATSILHAAATARTRRNMPEPIPAVLIGRLAVDRSWGGRGLGSSLLQDAVLRVAGAAHMIGVRALLVHALSDAAKAFYERHGFRPSSIDPMTLMITLAEVQRLG